MFLKTKKGSEEYKAINGFEKNHQRLELVEDSNGYYFVNDSVKNNEAFSEILFHLKNMEKVEKITFKISKVI